MCENPLCPLCDRTMAAIDESEGPIEKYECEEHGDFQETTVLVPVKILEFLKDHEKDMGATTQHYLSAALIDQVHADIEATGCEGPFFNYEEAIKNYNLNPIFKALRSHGGKPE